LKNTNKKVLGRFWIEEWRLRNELSADFGLQNVELEYLQSAICNQNESKIQNLKSEIPCVDAGRMTNPH